MARETAPPLATKVEIDDELADLVDRLVTNDPRDRLATASELATALDAWLAKPGAEGEGGRGNKPTIILEVVFDAEL